AVATQEWMIFVFLIPYCMGGLGGPAIQSEITNHVPSNEQGQIQGTLASLNSATATFGPLVMTSIFYYFTHDDASVRFPGGPFIEAADLMVAHLIVAYNRVKKTRSI